jgi:hypothetical protein
MSVKKTAIKITPHIIVIMILVGYMALLVLHRYLDDALIYYLLYLNFMCFVILSVVFRLYYTWLIFVVAIFVLPAFNFPYFINNYGRGESKEYKFYKSGLEVNVVKYEDGNIILFEKDEKGMRCFGKYKNLGGSYCRQLYQSLNNHASKPD